MGSLQVVAKMRDMVSNDTQNPVSNTFLLDDDLRLVILGEVRELIGMSLICMIHALKTHIYAVIGNLHICSIPFTTEEIAEEVPDIDMSNIEMPSSLRHVHSAQFLMQHLQSSYLSR